MDINIIGGGASGLVAAVIAARVAAERSVNARVTVFERNDRVGKKLLATGNGRCNLSNADISKKYYHSASMNVLEKIIDNSQAALAAFFSSLGLYLTNENGRLYPYAGKSSAVLDVLRMAADRLGVRTVTNTLIKYEDFREMLKSSKVILTTGGLAAPHTGSKGEGLRFLEGAGHEIVPMFPALTPLVCRHPALPSLKGIRVKPCALTLGGVTHEGEALFTENGLSGIPAMQLSGEFSRARNTAPNAAAEVIINLLPKMSAKDVVTLFTQRKALGFTGENFYTGLFHKSLGQALLRDRADPQNWKLTVTGVRGYDSAQVTGGGAKLDGFDPSNMRSRLNNNLFAAGEILDAYGDCGGYNLHWAWITGILAGQGAVTAVEEEL